jgi:hypothetical protein
MLGKALNAVSCQGHITYNTVNDTTQWMKQEENHLFLTADDTIMTKNHYND